MHYSIEKEKFAAFVAELRKEKGLTQKELAARLFISDKAVSKWETAASIPDTALFVPLAEELGVSVTELLLCRRLQEQETMDSAAVEEVVQSAIRAAEPDPEQQKAERRKWGILYAAALLCGILCTFLQSQIAPFSETLLTVLILGAIFGAYFCFWVEPRLPAYHDQYRITGMRQGPFRMNIPGLAFNNSNWPHIICVGRIWACAILVVLPLIAFLFCTVNAELWQRIERYVMLILVLGGLFLPVYCVGKKYE